MERFPKQLNLDLKPEELKDTFIPPESVLDKPKVAQIIRVKINNGEYVSPEELKFFTEERERQEQEDREDLENTYKRRK